MASVMLIAWLSQINTLFVVLGVLLSFKRS